MPVILDEDGAPLHADFTKTGLPTHYQTTEVTTPPIPYASRYGNPWLFNGRAWDAELGLYHYRNRYLDPVQGRFTTRDPIGIWGDPMNLGNGYSYVGNTPGTFVDPFGLQPSFTLPADIGPLVANASMPPRLAFFFQAISGVAEMGGGVAVGSGGTATGIGAVPGITLAGVIIGHGADNLQAGINGMIYGEEWRTYTEIGATYLTGSERAGAVIDLGLGFVDLGIGAVNYATRAPRICVVAAEGVANGAQLPRTLAQQRELARLAAEVREELLNNFDLLERESSSAQINSIAENPGLMQPYFGTVLETRVASRVSEIVRNDPSSVLSNLNWTGLTRAPQDFVGPGGHGFDITGNSRTSIMDHNARPAVDAVITYESIPRDLGIRFNNR